MPCYEEITPVVRNTLSQLEQALADRRATIRRDLRGKLVIDGWADRGDLTDTCALRVLSADGSSALRMALARIGVTDMRAVHQAHH